MLSCMPEMVVIVDSREPEVMYDLFFDAGFNVFVEELPVGDCIVLGPEGEPRMYFTLKSNNDMLGSVYSNHLHNEIYDLLQLGNDMFVAMVLWNEKYIGCRKGGKSRGRFVKGQVAERIDKINNFYIPVIKAKDRESAVNVIRKWSQRLYSNDLTFPIQYRRKVQLVGDNKMDQAKRLFLTLPGIGEGNIDAVMAKYDSFYAFAWDVKCTGEYVKAEYDTKKRWREMFVWYRDLPLGETSAERIFKILFGREPEHQ